MGNKGKNHPRGPLSPARGVEINTRHRNDHDLACPIAELETLLAPLALSGRAIAPSPELWDRIEDALESETVAQAHEASKAAAIGIWEKIAPGIEYKRLWDDRTFLLRCAAGAELHSHVHTDDEHLLILSGDLVIGGRRFVAGDYIGSPAGPDPHPHRTLHGCVLLCQTGA